MSFVFAGYGKRVWRYCKATYFLHCHGRNICDLPDSTDIVLFAAGDFSDTKTLLDNMALSPAIVCDTDRALQGEDYFGYKIHNTWDLLADSHRYHFVVPCGSDNLRHSIVTQLLANGARDFSVMHRLILPFLDELQDNKELTRCFIGAVNQLLPYHLDNLSNPSPDFLHKVSGLGWWHKIYEWLYGLVSTRETLALLEIGPGIGLLATAIKQFKTPCQITIDGLDYADRNLDRAVFREVFAGNIETFLPPPPENLGMKDAYDIIIMTEVIEHFSYNPVPTLQKIAEFLKVDGQLFLSCPHFRERKNESQLYQNWRQLPEIGNDSGFVYYGHIYEYSDAELMEILALAGYKVIQSAHTVQGNTNLIAVKA
jgi:2-polyprenyl-3-methyl-5-hydroxy-6-metoxy-1,4-benzoquinol methylase